jgi:glycine cleavage system H protein
MENPKDLKYTKEHEWVKLEGDIATIGITNHAQELLTDIVFVELPPLEKEVKQSEPLCVVESVKSVSDVFAPISGTVIAVNHGLENVPEQVNNDPYVDGWLVKLKAKHPHELDVLMSAQEYEAFIG